MRLLTGLYECVRLRSLKHYFIPSLNLLFVKMADQAHKEL